MELSVLDAWDLIDSQIHSVNKASPLVSPDSIDSSTMGDLRFGTVTSPETFHGQEQKVIGQHSDDVKPKKKANSSNKSKGKKEEIGKQPIQLPPCKVCGGNASGFHFGVITCGSCKVFFRRSLSKDTQYIRHVGKTCTIKSGKRKNCSFCRLKRCLEVGMSKDGVKKGRYTLERKHDYKTVVEKNENEKKQKREEEEKQKQMHKQLIRDTIDRLKQLHEKHRIVTPEVVERVKTAQVMKKEIKKHLEDTVGPTPSITPDEALEFFRATGVDITGFRNAVAAHTKSCDDVNSTLIIDYLKDLNEYMSLSLPDRIVVLKGAVNVWFLMSTYELVNTEDFLFTCWNCGMTLTDEEHRIFVNAEDFKARFKPIVKLNALDMTETEKAVLRAFVIFDTSQCKDELQEPEKVDVVQDFFMECLLYVMEENRGRDNAAKSFADIVYALTESRSMLIAATKNFEKAKEILQGVKYSKLTAEICDLPDSFVDDLGTDLDNLQL